MSDSKELVPEALAAAEAAARGEDVHFDSETSVGYLLRDTYRAFTKILQARISAHGVTIGQWYFLRVLWDEDGLTQRELSLRVGMMEPTTVTALNGMEKRGYVRRVRNTEDKRKVNIYLTETGQALRNVLLPQAIDVNIRSVAGVSPDDVETVRRTLHAMKQNLDALAV
ncbi:MAG: MarR family transcriptional regulator [Alphaproteobacteria bacterium]|nr:MarR family transcriptional regulator [Pseudomonadota bacterium]TDI67381.1 MAG: MarR family transcriptional regulator [Alphaproteobacteria bacterium]